VTTDHGISRHIGDDHGDVSFTKQTQPARFRKFPDVRPSLPQPGLEGRTSAAWFGWRETFRRAALGEPVIEFSPRKTGLLPLAWRYGDFGDVGLNKRLVRNEVSRTVAQILFLRRGKVPVSAS
jgi:hypothetical protein